MAGNEMANQTHLVAGDGIAGVSVTIEAAKAAYGVGQVGVFRGGDAFGPCVVINGLTLG